MSIKTALVKLLTRTRNIRAAEVTDDNWLAHFKQCSANGTMLRVETAWKQGTPVRIRRSSGEFQEGCKIVDWGFGGRAWQVTWGTEGNKRFKTIDIEKLLLWNPELDVCEDPIGA